MGTLRIAKILGLEFGLVNGQAVGRFMLDVTDIHGDSLTQYPGLVYPFKLSLGAPFEYVFKSLGVSWPQELIGKILALMDGDTSFHFRPLFGFEEVYVAFNKYDPQETKKES